MERSKHDSRAVVVHPRVMELLQPIDNGNVVNEIEKTAFHLDGVAFYVKTWFSRKGHEGDGDDHLLLNLRNVKWGDTKYPNLYFLPQYETERIMEEALHKAGVKVDYGIALDDLTQNEMAVTTNLVNNGVKETVTSKWLLGADGGRSKTRELVGIEMKRHHLGVYFFIADIVLKGDPPLDSHEPGKGGHIFPTDEGVIAMLPLPGENNYRMLGQAPEGIISKDQVDMNSAYFEKYLFERTGRKFNVELGELCLFVTSSDMVYEYDSVD